jgi:hypothetical protein
MVIHGLPSAQLMGQGWVGVAGRLDPWRSLAWRRPGPIFKAASSVQARWLRERLGAMT